MVDTHVMNYIDAPERTLVQRMEALRKGNEIRIKRAQFKKQMKEASKTGSREFAVNAILEPPEYMEGMKLYNLLVATRGFGKVKTGKYLQACLISPSKTLGGLTQRQRASIAGAVRNGLDWSSSL